VESYILNDNELELIIAGKIGPSGVIAPNIGWPSKLPAFRDVFDGHRIFNIKRKLKGD